MEAKVNKDEWAKKDSAEEASQKIFYKMSVVGMLTGCLAVGYIIGSIIAESLTE